jgi:hypothetical protein
VFFGVFKGSGSMIFQPHLAPICWFPYCSHRVELLSSLWHFSLSGKSGPPVVVFSLTDNHIVQYASPSHEPVKEHSTLDWCVATDMTVMVIISIDRLASMCAPITMG